MKKDEPSIHTDRILTSAVPGTSPGGTRRRDRRGTSPANSYDALKSQSRVDRAVIFESEWSPSDVSVRILRRSAHWPQQKCRHLAESQY